MLSLAVMTCLGFARLPQFERAADESVAWSQLSLDELLARLPRVDQEQRYDALTRQWVAVPAVEEMIRRLHSGAKLSDDQWRETLLRTGVLRFRSKWSADLSCAVSLRRPSWLPSAEVELFSNRCGVKSTEASWWSEGCCQRTDVDERLAANFRTLGRLPLGNHELTFEASVNVRDREARAKYGLEWSSGLLWSAPLRVEVEIVPTLDDAIPPYQDAEIDAAVRESVSVSFPHWAGDCDPHIDLLRDTIRHPVLADVAVSLCIEVVRERNTRETLQLVGGLLNDPVIDCTPSLDSANSSALSCELESNPSAQRAWSLRVSGTTDRIERLWGATRRWSGTIEIPLDEAIRRGAERESAFARAQKWSPSHFPHSPAHLRHTDDYGHR
jgi:hypothetical protein